MELVVAELLVRIQARSGGEWHKGVPPLPDPGSASSEQPQGGVIDSNWSLFIPLGRFHFIIGSIIFNCLLVPLERDRHRGSVYVFAATRGSLSTACSSASHPWLTYWSVHWLGRPDHHYSLERHNRIGRASFYWPFMAQDNLKVIGHSFGHMGQMWAD